MHFCHSNKRNALPSVLVCIPVPAESGTEKRGKRMCPRNGKSKKNKTLLEWERDHLWFSLLRQS